MNKFYLIINFYLRNNLNINVLIIQNKFNIDYYKLKITYFLLHMQVYMKLDLYKYEFD